MIGLNHALTGGLIAELLPLPIALPLAFASHFILDMLPHYGIDHARRDHSTFWRVFFTFDSLATFGLAVYAVIGKHYALFLGGLMAVMPDFLWVIQVIRSKSFKLDVDSNWFTRWHASIQKLERPWGIAIELPLAATLFYVVMIRLW